MRKAGRMETAVRFWKLGDILEAAENMDFVSSMMYFCLREQLSLVRAAGARVDKWSWGRQVSCFMHPQRWR